MDPLVEFALTRKIACLLIDHMPKAGNSGSGYSRGSGDKLAAVQAQWYVDRIRPFSEIGGGRDRARALEGAQRRAAARRIASRSATPPAACRSSAWTPTSRPRAGGSRRSSSSFERHPASRSRRTTSWRRSGGTASTERDRLGRWPRTPASRASRERTAGRHLRRYSYDPEADHEPPALRALRVCRSVRRTSTRPSGRWGRWKCVGALRRTSTHSAGFGSEQRGRKCVGRRRTSDAGGRMLPGEVRRRLARLWVRADALPERRRRRSLDAEAETRPVAHDVSRLRRPHRGREAAVALLGPPPARALRVDHSNHHNGPAALGDLLAKEDPTPMNDEREREPLDPSRARRGTSTRHASRRPTPASSTRTRQRSPESGPPSSVPTRPRRRLRSRRPG